MQSKLVGNAHIIAGSSETLPHLFALLEREGVEMHGNPDVYVREYRQFGIDEARELRERARSRALGTRRIFIIVTPSMTNDAQNALLKSIEEPAANAMFFFIVPAPHMLLPTLRSRAQILVLSSEKTSTQFVDAKKFLAAPPTKRLDMLKPLLEKDDDDKRDIGAIITFLSSLEGILGSMKKTPSEGAHAVYRARKYMGDKGALVKPLLEQVALLL